MDHVRSAMVELQEKVSKQSFCTPKMREYFRHGEILSSDQGSPRSNPSSREREVVRKGVERMEKQITQLISVTIS